MHTTSFVTQIPHAEIVYADDKNNDSSGDTSRKVEGLHKRILEEKEEAVLESKKLKAHDPLDAYAKKFKNKKVTCQLTVTSQDEECIFGQGIITENRRELRENKYEGGIKVVIASNRILRHGIGKVYISQLCSYQAEFKDNEEIKRI